MGRSSSKNTRPTAAEAPQGKGTLAVLDAAIGDYLLPTADDYQRQYDAVLREDVPAENEPGHLIQTERRKLFLRRLQKAQAELAAMREARDVMAGLIDTLGHVEQWMENHALPALGMMRTAATRSWSACKTPSTA